MRPAHLLLVASLLASLLTTPTPVAGQRAEPSVVTLERVFASGDFAPEPPPRTRWLADGTAYTVLEPSPGSPRGLELARYDARTGERRVLVPAARLVPSGARAPLTVEDYQWSPDGRKLLVYTNSRRVWRLNTRGDYWLLDLDTWALRKLG